MNKRQKGSQKYIEWELKEQVTFYAFLDLKHFAYTYDLKSNFKQEKHVFIAYLFISFLYG